MLLYSAACLFPRPNVVGCGLYFPPRYVRDFQFRIAKVARPLVCAAVRVVGDSVFGVKRFVKFQTLFALCCRLLYRFDEHRFVLQVSAVRGAGVDLFLFDPRSKRFQHLVL